MRKNIARVLLYTACAVLVVFYILVLWWGKNPKVGTEYRMYYLTHELTDWPGYGNLKYTFGTKEICTEHKDLKNVSLAAGESKEVVVLFQVKESDANSLAGLVMSATSSGKSLGSLTIN